MPRTIKAHQKDWGATHVWILKTHLESLNMLVDYSTIMDTSQQRFLVVICYPNDWHWVLSTEFVLSLSNQNVLIDILDLSTTEENSFRLLFKKLFKKDNLKRSLRKILKNSDANFVGRKYVLSEKIKNKFLFCKKFSSTVNLNNHPALNSIIEKIGNLKISKTRDKYVIRKELSAYNSVMNVISCINLDLYSMVVTVNGRFSKNAAVVKRCRDLQLKTNLIEFGSTLSKFEVFEDSPHSMIEAEKKIRICWDNAPEEHRTRIASNYLSDLVLSSSENRYGWRDLMIEGSIPKQKLTNRCTFFASTEAEYAGGVGDEIMEGNFRNQVEAFQSLVDLLPAKDWEIFLRRHPRARHGSDIDPEEFLWSDFTDIPNVFIVSPDSEIDSISLGLSSNFVMNFSSSIAIELAVRGFQSFATLGPAPWNQLLPKHYTPNVRTLKIFFDNPPSSMKITDLYPWAFYVATFGKDFLAIKYDNKKKKWILDL